MREEPLVSIIIPVWRDEEALTRTLQRLPDTPNAEIIVAAALGEEPRYRRAREQHPGIRWASGPRGRAAQMNAGAAIARGRWLLFLHADCRLLPDWLDAVTHADTRASIVAGAFRLALDSSDWRARVIEAGARVRVALLGLPYGDQALFVRRRTFTALGGYRDFPLMEDVDLVRRIKKVGRLLQARSAVVASARRWERDGWLRRSAQNASLATRFLFGASPARLAQQYFRRKAGAVVMMARAPWTGGKTRLHGAIGESDLADLRGALFLDTLDVVASLPDVDHVIACEPAEACERVREVVGPAIDVIAQRGDDLGQRMANVFEDTFRLGIQQIVVVGSDLPDLPSRLLREGFDAIRGLRDRVVLGPATDGGYYLVGMNRPHPELFEGIDWSTDRVLVQTLDVAKVRGLQIVLLDEWTDVDNAADLNRLMSGPSESIGPRSRAWAANISHRNWDRRP